LFRRFPEWDFEHLPDVWWGTVASDQDWKSRRVDEFCLFLWNLPFDSVVVIGHACFLKQLLFGDWPRKLFRNCEGVIAIMKNNKDFEIVQEVKSTQTK
jgi:hypothetical protein